MGDEIFWLSRAPAPYRYALWRELAKLSRLHVGFLHPTGINRPWAISEDEPFRQTLLPARGIRYREDALWFLTPGWRKRVADVGTVVFQGGWESPAFWQLALYCRRRGVRSVLFYESTLQSMRHTSGPVAAARRRFMSMMDAVVTPGPAATAAVLAHDVDTSKITTSVNVVDVDLFQRLAADERAVRVSDIPGHHFIVVAQLIPRKNHGAILSAFAEIADADDALSIVGSGVLADELRNLALSLHVDDRVRFRGQLSESEVGRAFGQAHTLVLASVEEVWGLVVNEALATGMHAVVSEACGVAESVSGMQGVFLCAPDEASVASAMRASREAWQGWIESPEILTHTAARLASDIVEASAV